jgi:hypothetical protein
VVAEFISPITVISEVFWVTRAPPLPLDRSIFDSVNDLLIHLGGRFARCWDLSCVADKDVPKTSIG